MALTKWNQVKKSTKSNFITFSIVIGFYIVVQLLAAAGVLTNSFSGQLVPICAYVVMAVSLNLVVGFLGELSLGHAGFMSVGAFSGTLVWVSLYDVAPHWLALILAFVVGGAMAGIFGVIVGVPVLRLSGDYLAIVTLAFGEIIKNIMNAVYLGVDDSGLHFSLKDAASMNMAEDGKILINGAMGITGIKKTSTFTMGIILVLITLVVVLNLIRSRAGRAISAIRDNEIAAKSIGINITRYKLMAFVLSSVFAGMAGVLYSLNYSSLVAKKFDYNTSIKYVGVNDHRIDLFEGQYKVPGGMSYNSYVILDEKIAVMDTVDADFTHQWLDNIQQVLDGRKPDYLIVQHMEPDHAANVANFLKVYPDTTVVATGKAFGMIREKVYCRFPLLFSFLPDPIQKSFGSCQTLYL